MSSSPFEQLKNSQDPVVQLRHEEEVQRRVLDQEAKSQARLGELIDSNTTLPTTLSSITVRNANYTREGFLARIFNPLLSANNDAPYTLQEAISKIGKAVDKLNRFDIFESPIPLYLDKPDPSDPSTTPTDLTATLPIREKPRLLFSTGAWAGSNDGSVQGTLLLRNIFGGAESLQATASRGTRTRSLYTGTFDIPILSNPDFRFELSGLASATQKSWASHEELLRGGLAKLRYGTEGGHRHEVSYNGLWRQATGLSETASPSVRQDAGDSFKSSMTHTWSRDMRDNPILPSTGTLMKTVAEVAGVGPLQGDVAFAKMEAESQMAVPLIQRAGISFTAGLRGGVIYPLALGRDPLRTPPQNSRITDRFTLGGPTDVRGFRLAGLGPRDGNDSVGGDVFAAGGASLYLPFPRVGKDVPLRMQLFVNGGRLLGLQDPRTSSSEKGTGSSSQLSASDLRQSVRNTIGELGREMPSVAAGLGVVYAMPVARFELNFSLPLVVRRGEEARKGLSLGVGISFL
ncbi:MAG: hypothetical protein Q9159_005547 [Coniocarpon cinnabarinum]